MRAQDARLIFYSPIDSDKNQCGGHGKPEYGGGAGHEALIRA